ncbi:MAG: sulfotransferase [Flavobacteriaceae bacterium]|nr:sulfotransferase [Flavobacteriaceae bacterium]
MESFAIDFFVVGAARSGTTSLYNYLDQHPGIFLSKVKELNHFSKVESNDRTDYDRPKKGESYHTKIIKSFEIYKGLFSQTQPGQIKGDVSPSYLWGSHTAKRIHDHNPKAKIIITLRNPMERAFSHFVMNYGVGYDREADFGKALKAKQDRVWGGGNLYLEWSTYFEAVKSYFELFPKEQIKLLVFEDWIKEKDQTLQEVFQFLGIDPNFTVDHTIQHNKKVAYKNIGFLNFLRGRFLKGFIKSVLPGRLREKVKERFFTDENMNIEFDPKLRDELVVYFSDDVAQLEALVEVPLLEKWGLKQEIKHD